MRHFFIIANETKDPGFIYCKKIEKQILEKCPEATVKLQMKNPKLNQDYMDKDWIPEDTECILVLGGDGTLLQAARETIELDIPLLGINLGTLGYLAEVEKEKIENAIDQLLEDRYSIEERMMLHGTITKKDGSQTVIDHALNDVVLTRAADFQVIGYDIYVNDQFLNSYLADGMIVATPTGSTGYNLSAGGPIVKPSAKTLLLTPVCPHTMNSRSIILSPDDVIDIVIADHKPDLEQNCKVCFDGSDPVSLANGDRIQVHRSVKVTRIIKLQQESFLKVLHQKMSV